MNDQGQQQPTITRRLLLSAGIASLPIAALGRSLLGSVKPRVHLRGVNCAGADFGIGSPFDSDGYFAFLASRGFKVIRLPFRWESVQDSPGGPLSPAYLLEISRVVTACTSRGMQPLLDVHNFLRYRDQVVDDPVGSVTSEHFVDLWTKLAIAFEDQPQAMFGLMNEPHDIPGGSSVWERMAQRAVTAIRATGATNWIWVAGDEWGSAAAYAERHPTWFIDDPLKRSGPEGHYYFDASNSRIGNYPNSYSQDEAAAISQNYHDLRDKVTRELTDFIDYCTRFDVHGLIGEIGWPGTNPSTSHPEDADKWASLGEAAYSLLDSGGVDVTYWAAGERWGAYNIALYTSQVATLMSPIVERHVSVTPTSRGSAVPPPAKTPKITSADK